MSHPDPRHDPENVYPQDGVRSYPKKKGALIKSLKHLVTKDHKASMKAGKKNAKLSEKIIRMAKKTRK